VIGLDDPNESWLDYDRRHGVELPGPGYDMHVRLSVIGAIHAARADAGVLTTACGQVADDFAGTAASVTCARCKTALA